MKVTPLIFDSDVGDSTPLLYNTIDTSHLIDRVGTLNMLIQPCRCLNNRLHQLFGPNTITWRLPQNQNFSVDCSQQMSLRLAAFLQPQAYLEFRKIWQSCWILGPLQLDLIQFSLELYGFKCGTQTKFTRISILTHFYFSSPTQCSVLVCCVTKL